MSQEQPFWRGKADRPAAELLATGFQGILCPSAENQEDTGLGRRRQAFMR